MKTDTVLDYRERILRVLHVVRDAAGRGDPPPSPAALAAVACFSRFHFHRVFSAMTGESASAYVRRIYLERAAVALRESERPVTEIALDAGYQAHESFTRAFTAHFGCAPRDYRRSSEPLSRPPALSRVHYADADSIVRFVPLSQEFPMLDVKIESVPTRRLAAIAHQGPYPEIGAAFKRIFEYAGQSGWLTGPVESVGIYYDDPDSTAASELRSHAGVTAPDSFAGEPDHGIEVISVPGGESAIGVFKGPYSGLHAAWRWFYATWLPESGREPNDQAPYEVYLNDCSQVAPEELLTAIHIPLKPAE